MIRRWIPCNQALLHLSEGDSSIRRCTYLTEYRTTENNNEGNDTFPAPLVQDGVVSLRFGFVVLEQNFHIIILICTMMYM